MTNLQLARLRYLRARAMYLTEVRKAEAFVMRVQRLRASADRPALLRPQA
jgi:hypothetical protein